MSEPSTEQPRSVVDDFRAELGRLLAAAAADLPPIPWWRRLRWRISGWWSRQRMRAGSWVAGVDLDREDDA